MSFYFSHINRSSKVSTFVQTATGEVINWFFLSQKFAFIIGSVFFFISWQDKMQLGISRIGISEAVSTAKAKFSFSRLLR